MLVLLLVLVPLIGISIVAARSEESTPSWAGPAFGLVAATATFIVAVVSFGSWDAPNVVRIGVPLAGLAAWVATVAIGGVALVRGPRASGALALGLALACLLASVAMVNAAY